jgi:methionine synthase II (cobalamin-independent)
MYALFLVSLVACIRLERANWPIALQETIKAYDEGEVSRERLLEEQDKAARDTITKMAATGELYPTDGEQRASSFATYPITE